MILLNQIIYTTNFISCKPKFKLLLEYRNSETFYLKKNIVRLVKNNFFFKIFRKLIRSVKKVNIVHKRL